MSDPQAPASPAGTTSAEAAPAGAMPTETTRTAPSAAPGERAPGAGPDLFGGTAEWPARAVDAIDLVVGTVNDRAVRPIVVAARAIVFGLLIAVIGLVVLVLVSVGLIRLLDVYVFPGRVWASYAVLGALFSILGLWAWSKRTVPAGSTGS